MSSFSVRRLHIIRKNKFPKICRTCGCNIKDDACKIENNPEKPELPLLLKRYIPELDAKIENPYLCVDCVSVLYVYHNFKRKCLQTEDELSLHKRKHPEVETVNLSDIFATKKQRNNITTFKKQKIDSSTEDRKHCARTEVIENEDTTELAAAAFEQIHKQEYESKRYQCDKCNRMFTLKYVYDKHIKYHETPNAARYICIRCNLVFSTSNFLKLHNISKHKTVSVINAS